MEEIGKRQKRQGGQRERASGGEYNLLRRKSRMGESAVVLTYLCQVPCRGRQAPTRASSPRCFGACGPDLCVPGAGL